MLVKRVDQVVEASENQHGYLRAQPLNTAQARSKRRKHRSIVFLESEGYSFVCDRRVFVLDGSYRVPLRTAQLFLMIMLTTLSQRTYDFNVGFV
jgi:hypothetical protein